jgi:peptidoglycan/LPS O-acetylase OafA/YrhL
VVWPVLAFLAWLPVVRRHRLTLMALVFLGGASLWGVTDGFAVHYLVIAIGCLVAVLMHDRRTFPVVAVLVRPVPAALCWVAFVGYHLAVPSLTTAVGDLPLVVLGYGVMVGLIMPSLVGLPALTRVFGGRVLRWWGERSYSLYLVQQLAGWVVASLLPVFSTQRLISGVAVVLCSALLADLVYRWVEAPGIRLGRRFVAGPARSRSGGPLPGPSGAVVLMDPGGHLPAPRAYGDRPVGARVG